MSSLGEFVRTYRRVTFDKGETMLHQEEDPRKAYYVHQGIVKVYTLTANGEEKPISFSTAGELLPLEWVFSKYKTTPYYYEAFTKVVVYAVPKNDVLDFLHQNPPALMELADKLVERRITHQMHINALQQSKAADKALHALNLLAYSFGKPTKDGLLEISIPLSQQGLANFMGLTRETMSIELKKLELKDVLIPDRPYYLLDMVKLQQVMGRPAEKSTLTTKPKILKNILYRLR